MYTCLSIPRAWLTSITSRQAALTSVIRACHMSEKTETEGAGGSIAYARLKRKRKNTNTGLEKNKIGRSLPSMCSRAILDCGCMARVWAAVTTCGPYILRLISAYLVFTCRVSVHAMCLSILHTWGQRKRRALDFQLGPFHVLPETVKCLEVPSRLQPAR